jgi:hypothetical protein
VRKNHHLETTLRQPDLYAVAIVVFIVGCLCQPERVYCLTNGRSNEMLDTLVASDFWRREEEFERMVSEKVVIEAGQAFLFPRFPSRRRG